MADFPINAVARRAQYVVGSSGQAGPYAFSFAILDDDDIAVYVGSTLKTKTTHYTVTRSLATGTGSITFVGGQEPVENDLVTLISAQALARTSDYTSGGDLQASSLNDDLDRLTIGQQQIAETLDRSVQLPLFTSRDTSSLGVGPLLFPYDATPANQANKVIGYDAAGTALVALTPNTSAFITTPGSATDNAVARFDGTSGAAFQNSPVTIDDAGAVAGVTTLNGTAVSALLDTADIGVTVQGYDADTTKNDVANAFTATQRWAKGADVASASALTLGSGGNYFDVTGTTTITSIATVGVGTWVCLHFDSALTLTHNATDLILPGGANITTAAGDEAIFIEYASGDWRCVSYTKASGEAVVSSGGALEFVSSATASSDASIDFTGLAGGYTYFVELVNVRPASGGTTLQCRFGHGSTTWISSGYDIGSIDGTVTPSTAGSVGASLLSLGGTTSASEATSGQLRVVGIGDTTDLHFDYRGCRRRSTAAEVWSYDAIGGVRDSNTKNAIQFYFSSGNVASGTFILYRRKRTA